MKRTPFYRRPGKVGKFSGLRERVIWMIQTRGRPVTGSEIAEKFGVTLVEFNRVANGITKGKAALRSWSHRKPGSTSTASAIAPLT